jgi:hypothetical protein
MEDEKRKKSGSEKRKRNNLLQIRLTDFELAEIEALADRAELTPASYARLILLSSPAPRAKRRPAVDTKQVAQLLAEVGKIGSNVNQIAHHLNAGLGTSSTAIQEALDDVAEMRKACMEALNRKP